MAANISTDTPAMVRAQGYTQNTLDEINAVYTGMDEERSSLAANWTGEAASAFGQALQSWLDDLQVVQNQLSTILENLSTNTGIYANTAESSQQVATAFGQGLSGLSGL
jgi:WXG100 family type VII secretion target